MNMIHIHFPNSHCPWSSLKSSIFRVFISLKLRDYIFVSTSPPYHKCPFLSGDQWQTLFLISEVILLRRLALITPSFSFFISLPSMFSILVFFWVLYWFELDSHGNMWICKWILVWTIGCHKYVVFAPIFLQCGIALLFLCHFFHGIICVAMFSFWDIYIYIFVSGEPRKGFSSFCILKKLFSQICTSNSKVTFGFFVFVN